MIKDGKNHPAPSQFDDAGGFTHNATPLTFST